VAEEPSSAAAARSERSCAACAAAAQGSLGAAALSLWAGACGGGKVPEVPPACVTSPAPVSLGDAA